MASPYCKIETETGREGHNIRLVAQLVSAELAWRIDADLESIGQSIGRVDPLIAAITIRHSRVLITGNGPHYGRIRSLGYALRLEDWRQPV